MEDLNTPGANQRWHHRHSKKALIILIILILVAVCLSSQQIWLAMTAKGYQAVFLSNGQVYFGKLSSSGRFYKLTDIYYLQVTQTLQPASSEAGKTPAEASATPANQQQNIELIKLGNELHGPSDAMYIERDKLLFWENMKNDSKVVDTINKYKAGQKQ